MTTDTVIDQTAAFASVSDVDQEIIEGTMQMSPDQINVRNVGTSESIQALVTVVIPAGYVLIMDYIMTSRFIQEDVTTAYDVYYCPIDNNMKISFLRSEILASPVTLKYVNTVAVAAVNGYFRVEGEDGSYDTSLSTKDDFGDIRSGPRASR